MKKAHFYAYGVIANESGTFAEEFGIVSAKSFADFISANAGADELVIHINSQGGDVDEGFAIHDLLSTSGKKVTTIIEGMCASIATVVALAGTTREITENATFFIHNAWGGAMGDAEELQKYTDSVKKATNKIIDFYVSKTGAERIKVAELMDKDTSLTAIEAKELGFVTNIRISVAAKALTLTKINSSKNDNKILNEMKTEIKNFISDIKKALNIKNEGAEVIVAMAMDVETDKGTLHIEKPSADGVVSVGDVCTIDGQPATEGDYTTNDGSVYAVDASGVVTAVTVKEEDNKDTEEVTGLKEELKNAKAELETIKAEKLEFENKVEAELKTIKASIKSTYTPPADKTTFNKGAKELENPAADLKARKESYKKK